MTFWIENYFICFALSAVLAGFIIPKVLLIAFRRQLFDEVNERKIHKGAVPRLGGIAFLPSLIFSICIVLAVDLRTEIFVMGVQLHETIVPIFFLICALMLMYLTGIADDLIGVRYRGKFIFQIIAGALIAMSGLYIRNLFGFFGIGAVNAWLGVAATIFLAIFVINAINLIDGIDGLASGLSAIALTYYSYIFYQAGEYIYAMLAGATLGTLVPFFYYNVFGNAANHTKIFMGDTGSLTIGTILSFLSMAVFNLRPDQAPDASENLFVLAVTPPSHPAARRDQGLLPPRPQAQQPLPPRPLPYPPQTPRPRIPHEYGADYYPRGRRPLHLLQFQPLPLLLSDLDHSV